MRSPGGTGIRLRREKPEKPGKGPDVSALPIPIRISGRTTRTALILAGIVGVIVAVPLLAVLRVLLGFFRVCPETDG